VVALDAHIITFTIAGFIYLSFTFAIGIAASIRVGQLIGDQRAKDAERSSHASYLLSGIVQIILSIILFFCKDIVGDLFSNDEEVSNLVSVLIPISCIFMVGGAIQGITGGVLRGLGRQKLVLLLNVLGFWVCALPIGAVLTFVVGLGVNGLWWGFNIGLYATAAVGIWFLKINVDWEQEAKKTVRRLSSLSPLTSGSSVLDLTKGKEENDVKSCGTDIPETQPKSIREPTFEC